MFRSEGSDEVAMTPTAEHSDGNENFHLLSKRNINDLPAESLWHIFSYLNPYKDYDSCKQVCGLWDDLIDDLKPRLLNRFIRSLKSLKVYWERYETLSNVLEISNRYGHCAVYSDNFMYVFGGFTSQATSFNDLWSFDLSNRNWRRLHGNGQIPPPKGTAVMVAYNNRLFLFGGMSFLDARSMSNDLHVFDVRKNLWTKMNAYRGELVPPKISAHSATVHGNRMVVFGGKTMDESINDIYVLDLDHFKWRRPVLKKGSPRPVKRYGHSQIALDDQHLLIMGGCTVYPFEVLGDMWMLDMSGAEWSWTKIDLSAEIKAVVMTVWCHGSCKVGNCIVGFTHHRSRLLDPASYLEWFPSNITGHLDPTRPQYLYSVPLLDMYVIDISKILENPKPQLTFYRGMQRQSPEDTIMYSLVAGHGELLMFGGIQRDKRQHVINGSQAKSIASLVVSCLHIVKTSEVENQYA